MAGSHAPRASPEPQRGHGTPAAARARTTLEFRRERLRTRGHDMNLRCALTLACLSLSGPAAAHGGQYRVPTLGDPSSPGSPSAGGGPVTLSEGADWRLWWTLNWDRIIDLRSRLMLGPTGP